MKMESELERILSNFKGITSDETTLLLVTFQLSMVMNQITFFANIECKIRNKALPINSF